MQCPTCPKEMRAVGVMGQPDVHITTREVISAIAITYACDHCKHLVMVQLPDHHLSVPGSIKRKMRDIETWVNKAMETHMDFLEQEYNIDTRDDESPF